MVVTKNERFVVRDAAALEADALDGGFDRRPCDDESREVVRFSRRSA